MIQETATDSRVILLDCNSMKLKATLLFPNQLLKKVTFCPSEAGVVVTTGANHFRVWKIIDGQFKPFQQVKLNQNHIYTDHIWLEKDLLLAFSQDGEMYLYDQ
jgi:WD40 repeat protein